MSIRKKSVKGVRPRHSKFFWVYRPFHYKTVYFCPFRSTDDWFTSLSVRVFQQMTGFRMKQGQWVKMYLVK